MSVKFFTSFKLFDTKFHNFLWRPWIESDRQRTSALQPVASYEDDWDFDEVKPSEETMVEDDGDALFQVTDVDYDINELAKGLESLLDEWVSDEY